MKTIGADRPPYGSGLGDAAELDEYTADLCAGDWGLWRTCRQTIERCLADLAGYLV